MTILRTLAEVAAIDLAWEGPFGFDAVVQGKNTNRDYGIYRICGSHPIFGPDSPL